ncbi:MAG: translation initiation factor IF-2 [Parcubacteria group bacterium]|nr:translation initiation factor IF-2 [Parcubacteria group bacterium]
MEQDIQQKKNNLISRPPIVVVLGHVDHGKTSLLDYIRKTKVAEKETGGITQHIGAYEIEVKGKRITFLDTPGHEAFSKIRSRGAKVADIALLIIAADEGIKPQTKESLECIKQAQIPFIVVLTKIDKEGANPDKVKKDLTELGVYLEGWGGDISVVQVSARTGEGIDDLLDLILLTSEIEELTGNPQLPASGTVIESHLDNRRGITATLIITNGTLKLQDKIIAGQAKGKVKILEDFQGQPIEQATFSSPVRVIGFEEMPPIGEKFMVYSDETEIDSTEKIQTIIKKELGDLNSLITIPTIIKTDTLSSSEALEPILDQLGQEQSWKFRILINDVGDLSESDLKIVPKEPTLIITFRVKQKAEIANIFLSNPYLNLVSGDIIYELKDKIIATVKDQFINKPTEEIIGRLEVLAIFNPIKGKQLIGGRVIEGRVQNKVRLRIFRKDQLIGEGKIINLQKNRRDVDSVELNEECGLLIDSNIKISQGDYLEFFQKI